MDASLHSFTLCEQMDMMTVTLYLFITHIYKTDGLKKNQKQIIISATWEFSCFKQQQIILNLH